MASLDKRVTMILLLNIIKLQCRTRSRDDRRQNRMIFFPAILITMKKTFIYEIIL